MSNVIIYSYLVSCCPRSDLFGKESRYWAKRRLNPISVSIAKYIGY